MGAVLDPQSFKGVTETREAIEEEKERRAKTTGGGDRWATGPDSGGRIQQEAYAMAQAKKAAEERERKEQIDVARFRTDPEYRQALMDREAAKLQAEREQREARQREDGDRKLTDDRRREEAQLNPGQKSDSEEIDVSRFRTDPTYRKELMDRAAAQVQGERSKTDRPRELERDDSQR